MSYLIFCTLEVGGQPFRIAEILNRFGVDAYYVYLGPNHTGHDSTQFHYGNRDEPWYLSSMFQANHNATRDVLLGLKEMKAKYHITHCLATGTASYLLALADMNYCYWSYGSDLDWDCFIRMRLKNKLLRLKVFRHPFQVYAVQKRARDSIRYSDSVMVSPYQIKALRKIVPDKSLFFLPHSLRVMDFTTLVYQKEMNKKSICREIQADRYFFSSVRHCWTDDWKRMPDYKGNDVMLHSYARYLSLAKNDQSKLVLVEKGPDVGASKILSRRLGIEKRIVWIDEMKRDELDRFYQGADLCFGHFGTPVLTYAVLEALKNGTTGISYSMEHQSDIPFYEELSPVFNSKSPREIADFMVEVLHDPPRFNQLSQQSWLWIREHCSEERFVESFLNLFGDVPRPIHSGD